MTDLLDPPITTETPLPEPTRPHPGPVRPRRRADGRAPAHRSTRRRPTTRTFWCVSAGLIILAPVLGLMIGDMVYGEYPTRRPRVVQLDRVPETVTTQPAGGAVAAGPTRPDAPSRGGDGPAPHAPTAGSAPPAATGRPGSGGPVAQGSPAAAGAPEPAADPPAATQPPRAAVPTTTTAPDPPPGTEPDPGPPATAPIPPPTPPSTDPPVVP